MLLLYRPESFLEKKKSIIKQNLLCDKYRGRGEKEEKSSILVCLYSTLRTYHKYQAIHKGMWPESWEHTQHCFHWKTGTIHTPYLSDGKGAWGAGHYSAPLCSVTGAGFSAGVSVTFV